MINLQDKNCCPTVTQINEYIGNPISRNFAQKSKTHMNVKKKLNTVHAAGKRGGISNSKKLAKHYVLSIQEKIILQF